MRSRTLYVFAFCFLLFIVSAVIRFYSFGKMRSYTEYVDHSREVITSLEKLSSYFKSAQIYSPAYEVRVAKNYYTLYRQEALKIDDELQKLHALAQNNKAQRVQIDTLSSIIQVHLPILMEYNVAELVSAGEAWRLSQLFKISTIINYMVEHEEQTLIERKQELRDSIYWNNVLSLVLIVIAAITISITFIMSLLENRQRRQLEVFLGSILNASQSGIVSFKAVRQKGKISNFKITYANETMQKILHLKPEEVVGKKINDLPDFLSTESIDKFKRVVENREGTEYESFFKKNNESRWFHVRLAPLEDGFTATLHDITAIKSSEAELKVSVQQLEKSNKELEQYAYAASHDLQEPLRKIQTFSHFLWERQGDSLDEKGKHYLQKILTSSARMSTLIRDILSFSSFKEQMDFIPTDLNAELNNVLQDLELLIAQKGATVQKEELLTIDAIPLQMRQLFYNLVNNALKFTAEDRPPVITINCRLLPASEIKNHEALNIHTDYCEVMVGDNGIGFSNSHSQQIFNLFKRLNNKDAFEGSGIGLALCQKVVENHHGTIYAKGEEGMGAQFYIILPVKQKAPVIW